jgi:hypothetical protein
MRYVFWPDGVNENDEVVCPDGSGGPVQYWFPTFGYAHKDALIGYKLKGTSPLAGFDIRGGWTITQTGSAEMATRDFSGTFPFKDGTATESSHFILRHTPNQ